MPRETVNVVSDDPFGIVSREEPRDTKFRWIYTTEPVGADWHVVLGVTRSLQIPNPRERLLFVVGEPPEVKKYDVCALSEYGSVLAPMFPYLRKLRNFVFAEGLLPWRAGLEFEGDQTPAVKLYRDDLENMSPVGNSGIAAVVSDKKNTPMQVARLRLIESLQDVVPEIEVWGRGSREVRDTAEVFSSCGVSIAAENSIYPGYWTEKLADPLLFLNRVAYLGHRENVKRYSSRQVLLLNPYRVRDSQKRFLEWLDIEPNTADLDAALAARAYILDTGSFHRVVENRIGLIRPETGNAPATVKTLIPGHQETRGVISLRGQLLKATYKKLSGNIPGMG